MSSNYHDSVDITLTVEYLISYIINNCTCNHYDKYKTTKPLNYNNINHNYWGFLSIQQSIRENVLNNRLLSSIEQKTLSKALKLLYNNNYNSLHVNNNKLQYNYQIFTGYSNDYSIGYLCDYINEKYASKHSYRYTTFIDEYTNILTKIAPRTHCTWFKVCLLLNYLNDKTFQDVDYFLWIDADAIVINDSISLDDIVNKSKHKNLIISEDVNTCCYVNAGVLLVRNCDWSRSFWTDVWNNSNYFNVKHYEQSAIIKCLRMRDEGLNNLKPFHSFIISTGSGSEHTANRCSIKIFPNIAVVSHSLLNSNSICTSDVDYNSIDIEYYDTINNIDCSTLCNEYYATSSAKRKPNYINVKDMSPPLFIYHPAGFSDKLKYLLDYLERVNIYVPEELKKLNKLKLNRSKASIIAGKDVSEVS